MNTTPGMLTFVQRGVPYTLRADEAHSSGGSEVQPEVNAVAVASTVRSSPPAPTTRSTSVGKALVNLREALAIPTMLAASAPSWADSKEAPFFKDHQWDKCSNYACWSNAAVGDSGSKDHKGSLLELTLCYLDRVLLLLLLFSGTSYHLSLCFIPVIDSRFMVISS